MRRVVIAEDVIRHSRTEIVHIISKRPKFWPRPCRPKPCSSPALPKPSLASVIRSTDGARRPHDNLLEAEQGIFRHGEPQERPGASRIGDKAGDLGVPALFGFQQRAGIGEIEDAFRQIGDRDSLAGTDVQGLRRKLAESGLDEGIDDEINPDEIENLGSVIEE